MARDSHARRRRRPTSSVTPPATLSVRWCDGCGRTDRHEVLQATHFDDGEKLCPGRIHTATYELSEAN